MIKHIVMWRLHDQALGRTKSQNVQLIKEKLEALEDVSAGILKVEVGFDILGRGVIREGSEVFAKDGAKIGAITSGGFGPSVGDSIAQGYVTPEFSSEGTEVEVELRGSKLPAKVRNYTYIQAKTKK